MLVGAGMGTAALGSGFGFYSGFIEVMELIYPPETVLGNRLTFNHYAYTRYLFDIALGTYATLLVTGIILTWFPCQLRSRRLNRRSGSNHEGKHGEVSC